MYLLFGLGVHLELPLQKVHGVEAGGVLLTGQSPVVRVGGAVVQDPLIPGYRQLSEPHLDQIHHMRSGFNFVKLVNLHLIISNWGEDLVVELCPSEHGNDGGAHHVLRVGHRVRPQGQEERIAVLDTREAIIRLTILHCLNCEI